MNTLEKVAPTWEQVHAAIRSLAKRRAAFDAEEAQLLRDAEAVQIWRPLGMVSLIDYMEREMGYSPHAAEERLRVARALAVLPMIEEALGRGELSFSAVRELTRVATPETERDWASAASGKNLRQIEDLVAGHRKGDRPSDLGSPQVRPHVVRMELQPETFAGLRQARGLLADEVGRRLDDNEVMAALIFQLLAGKRERAQHQLGVVVCERCKQGWQDGAGVRVPISAAAVALAECDAEHIGSLDADMPERARQDVTPAVARFVWARDGGKCRVPGCRSARALHIHHLVPRAEGGGHDPSNLILICSSCHAAHHDGRITVTGTADAIEVRRSHVGVKPDQTRELAINALVELGWKRKRAASAADAAISTLGAAPLEEIIRAALQQCWQIESFAPRP
jgi:hypothetical protein